MVVGAGNRARTVLGAGNGRGQQPLTLWDPTMVARASSAGASIHVMGVDDG
jgi:hypothetical protein